jgi:hypothetical protein
VSTQESAISYATDVKPLFRDKDRSSMLRAFDLWSYDDVRDNASAILDALDGGSMPCDGAWPADRVDVFRRWVAEGTPV